MKEREQHDNGAWEARINALLDGELGEAEAEELKQAANDDQRLAREIIEAYQLQQALEQLRVEAAPASLTRRLRRIPREQSRRTWFAQPRWAAAFAAVPLAVLALWLAQPREPSRAEIERAAADLAIAFSYIEKVSDKTVGQIEREVGGELQQAVGGSMIRSIPKTTSESQEKQA